MDDLSRKEVSLIACSENHAVAVGNYGHLYVWGSSLAGSKLIEEISECDSGTDESSSYQFMYEDEYVCKIGFCDPSIKTVEKPVFYSLRHPVYEIKASQVACARDFTAVVAVEKGIEDMSEETDYERILFSREIDDFPSEFRQPQDLISEADHRKSHIANRIRQQVEDYLKQNSTTFIDLFKSHQIKLESFINIMTEIVNTDLKAADLYEFIEYKNMRLAGKSISLKPLYELVVKCHQGQGVLYILGQKDKIVPKLADTYRGHSIKHDTLGYYLIQLPDQISIMKVACGNEFVIFLTHQGTVFSWGASPTPALGKNRWPTYQSIKPIPELNSNNSYIKDICCGVNHCIALNVTGVVYTWGEGLFGKLGNGRLDNCARSEPISIHNNDVVMIRAGHHSSFSKTRDGSCFAWGDLSVHKFGPCSTSKSDKPFRFLYEFDVVDMAIGTKSCVFVAQNGLLYQTLQSDEQITCLNRKYKHLEGIQFYQACAFGSNFFALSSKGSIYSWNTEDSSFLLGRTNDPGIPTELSSCSQHFHAKEFDDMNFSVDNTREPSRQVFRVACTEDNTFLITDKGEAIAAGDNSLGQMCVVYGDVDVEDERNPDDFYNFQIIPRLSMNFGICIKSIECGVSHVLAINEEFRVMAWGSNNCGQLGNGSFSKCEKYPEIVQSLKHQRVDMVSAGNNYSMVLNDRGEVFAFGSAEFGKLGIGMVNPSVMYSLPTLVKNLKGIKKISSGEAHSAAISREDEILVWGYGWNGQLGCGMKESLFEPTVVLTHIRWKDVSCGSTHTLGLSFEGTIYHWGETNLDKEEHELLVPTKVVGLEEIRIKRVIASNKHSIALTENGSSLYCWGQQMYNRIIGAKDFTNGQLTRAIPVTVPYNEKIIDVGLGPFHGVYVTDHGKVYIWGYPHGGRLGEKAQSGQDSKPYNGKFVDLSNILLKSDQEAKEEFKTDLQALLQAESDSSKEVYLREVDQQILTKFKDCIDFFIKLSEMDHDQQGFFNKIEHKQLNRLQQEPFRAELVLNQKRNEEIDKRAFSWAALITTYQMHCCYVFKLLSIKLKEEKKAELLNLVYCDMEKDSRLIYTAIYLAKMLLEKLLTLPGITFPGFIDLPEANTYRTLVFMIVSASVEDMNFFRKIVTETLHVLSQVVNADENGIDLDPTHTAKNGNLTIKISAYQMNKNIIDRRMGKLKQVMVNFVKILDEFFLKENLSSIVYFICKDFFSLCSKIFEINYKNFERLNDNSVDSINIILKIVLEPLCKMIENPDKFYVVYDFLFENKEINLKSLSETVSKFFEGNSLGGPGERWFHDVNKYLLLDENMRLKAKIVSKILCRKLDLEEKYIESIFLHSLEPFDKEVTVSGQSLLFLHRITEKHFENLRVNNPSYDPLAIILKDLAPYPASKLFGRNDNINLSLFTRCLRQDQSLVRCPTCQMLISRDMAPSKFSQVIEIYDPMPPNSSEAIMTYILATGPRKQKKAKILDYIMAFEENYLAYLKDFSVSEKVKNLINNVDTITSSSLEIAIEDADEVSRAAIEKNREKIFKVIEENCSAQYKRRMRHIKLQVKISNSLNKLENVLRSKEKDTTLTSDVKTQLLFNVGYGASNLELELFSDSVMFSLFANKIREYTAKKEMSINLFENLTNEMKDRLRGFMKRSLNDLVKKQVIYEYTLTHNYSPKDIVFCFELDSNDFIIIATNSPKKMNLCGRDEFREEELLLYEKISDSDIAKMREDCKAADEKDKLT